MAINQQNSADVAESMAMVTKLPILPRGRGRIRSPKPSFPPSAKLPVTDGEMLEDTRCSLKGRLHGRPSMRASPIMEWNFVVMQPPWGHPLPVSNLHTWFCKHASVPKKFIGSPSGIFMEFYLVCLWYPIWSLQM